MTGSGPVTVVVPVYGGPESTSRCLASLVRHATSASTAYEILVIDDCSPDPGLRGDLEAFADLHRERGVRLVRNEANLGFVGSVNRGLRETAGDVVLLNSDTVVTEGWLDRLLAVSSASSDVATVTPLTNDRSICRLPERIIARFGLDGPEPRIDECGAFVAEYGLGLAPEVITGVGFCMLVTRSAVDECGLFDEATFGKGYGEEVDFCLRATRLGYRHLVDDRTFVFHEGGVSFGGIRTAAMARADAVIRARYRFFAPTNRRERREDPLAVSVAALEEALDPRRAGRSLVLHVLHAPSTPPGGTERHVEALIRATFDSVDAAVLHPVESGFLLRTETMTGSGDRATREYLLPGAAAKVSQVSDSVAGAALQLALDLFDVDVVHLHNLIGHSLAPLEVCREFPGPVLCTLHDFFLACPNHPLLYRDQVDCGVPDDLTICAGCLPASSVHESVQFLQEFRDRVGRDIDVIDRFVVADVISADYVRRVHDLAEDRVTVIEHGSVIDVPARRSHDERAILDEPLRFAMVGRGWTRKGLGVLNHLASELTRTGMEFHHFGQGVEPIAEEVRVHGVYDNAELPQLLREAGVHVVLLPGPGAETYSFVLTEALVAGLPVIGAGHGALGRRIRELGVGWTVDPTDPAAVRELVENLDRCRPEILRATIAACSAPVKQPADLAESYLALYQEPPVRTVQRPRSDAMAEDRTRRQMRALAAVNRQLHAQIDAQPPPRGQRLAARAQRALERSAPRLHRCAEIAFETWSEVRGLVASAQDTARRRGSGGG
jgi:GT2 family glycosyltransferase/glycosyltransferase involved in cell wall biosynthesis